MSALKADLARRAKWSQMPDWVKSDPRRSPSEVGSSSIRVLDQLLRELKPGDTLITWKLGRLGRSLRHLIAIVAELDGRGICFSSLSEAIDTKTASGRLLFHVLGALAEFERALISERTNASRHGRS